MPLVFVVLFVVVSVRAAQISRTVVLDVAVSVDDAVVLELVDVDDADVLEFEDVVDVTVLVVLVDVVVSVVLDVAVSVDVDVVVVDLVVSVVDDVGGGVVVVGYPKTCTSRKCSCPEPHPLLCTNFTLRPTRPRVVPDDVVVLHLRTHLW